VPPTRTEFIVHGKSGEGFPSIGVPHLKRGVGADDGGSGLLKHNVIASKTDGCVGSEGGGHGHGYSFSVGRPSITGWTDINKSGEVKDVT
jgi:hypothetical protein